MSITAKALLLRLLLVIAWLCCWYGRSGAQTAWFIDGYHGGIYGGYPDSFTRFIVNNLNKYPQWKINLEIEPETWDRVEKIDPAAYEEFKALAANQTATGRIEFINPSYAQSYLYNISGESIIRQFSYGIKKLRSHFPDAVFSSYSSEEPCFTSALPQILISFGFKYASLKNPNTCFGGYTAAHGGELIRWIGPDGTSILTVPRYGMEKLSNRSTWQTIGWETSPSFINTAYADGIKHPLGMTIQDAGWKNGPFMGINPRQGISTIYTTWKNYFGTVTANDAGTVWKPSQEDMLVNLVWGSQVTQKIAQEVRVAENKVIVAEKMASLAKIYTGAAYPAAALDSAWTTLMLSQHHDCWIVPYNGKPGNTWADNVLTWTNFTNQKCDSIISVAQKDLTNNHPEEDNYAIRVFNTLGIRRNEIILVTIPARLTNSSLAIEDQQGKEVTSQIIADSASAPKKIVFKADVPSIGFTTYKLVKKETRLAKGAAVEKLPNGNYKVSTDLYTLLIDPSKGGIINSLKAKKLNNKEFVDKSNARGFNELRGNFYKNGGFKSSEDNPAKVEILQAGPLLVKLAIKGTIDGYLFTQQITLQQGEPKINITENINWNGNPGIGQNTPAGTYDWKNPKKAFYDDRYKLLALFPLNLKDQKVYKNAPFDVTESKLDNTFYNSWDSIKNNVILNWVDVTDNTGKYGMALFTDHTTSYTHGKDFPLGLDLQYSGMGLWGRDYKINGPSTINYALIPHSGKWDASGMWTEGTKRAEPLTAQIVKTAPDLKEQIRSFVSINKPGYEISSMTFDNSDLLIRVFNAEGDNNPEILTFDTPVKRVELVELNGDKRQDVNFLNKAGNKTEIVLTIPRFGFRTIKIIRGY